MKLPAPQAIIFDWDNTLVDSWPTIVELISIYKRLRAFEATLEGAPLPEIDQAYLERERAGLRPEDQPVS